MYTFPRTFLACSVGWTAILAAQPEADLLVQDEHFIMGDTGEDPAPYLSAYEVFNKVLGGDSVRLCGGKPCIGWVEDHYPEGGLKHRGYYDGGRLTIYRNFHANGAMERDFKALDAVKSVQRTYHANGQLRSDTRYVNGQVLSYQDHYLDGRLRYAEERHRSEPYFVRMDLFAADGQPVSLLQLVDKKRVEFVQKEFYPGGALKSEGRARYDPSRMDTHRIGTWTYYDTAGTAIKAEDYRDGRVAMVH
jgi:antitoxin component YwqK of YwqJK toxin-antitoxin module